MRGSFEKLSVYAAAFFVTACVYIVPHYAHAANLVVNGDAETGDTTGWTVVSGGDGWLVAEGFAHDGDFSFLSSYSWGTMSQEIDLSESGNTDLQMDQQPTIDASVWVRGYDGFSGADDPYQVQFVLRDADHNTLASYDTGEVVATDSWVNVSHTFTAYGEGVRYVYIELRAKDSSFWAGNYGAAFDDVSVELSDLATTYMMIYGADEHGSISGETEQEVLPGGDGSEVTAVPDAGYTFVEWDDASTDNPRTDLDIEQGLDVVATFADLTAPESVSITTLDGITKERLVGITVDDGIDDGSGIDIFTRMMGRSEAVVVDGECGEFGEYTDFDATGTYPNFEDASVLPGYCYKYQYSVSDVDGNQTVYTGSEVAQIAEVVSVTGEKEGKISVEYSDSSTAEYTIFPLAGKHKTTVAQYGDTQYCLVLKGNGRVIRLVDVTTGEVKSSMVLSKKWKKGKHSLQLFNFNANQDDTLEALVLSKGSVRTVAVLIRIDWDALQFVSKSKVRLLPLDIRLGKTQLKSRSIVLKDASDDTVTTLRVGAQYRLRVAE